MKRFPFINSVFQYYMKKQSKEAEQPLNNAFADAFKKIGFGEGNRE